LNGAPLYTFELVPGFNFMKIFYDHHIPLTYNGIIIRILLSGIIGDQLTPNMIPTFLGNVPVSIINTTHQVYITLTQNDVEGDITLITLTDPTYFSPNPNYFFIVLPIGLQIGETYTISDYNFNLTYLTLDAIPLNTLNTSSQVNPNQLTSFHIIQSIDETGINIALNNKAITDTDAANNNTTVSNGGGNFVIIGHVSGISDGYPDANNYTITLPETYYNVVSIKLVSSEMPNANKTIRDFPPESANNKLYWNDIDDGDFVYSISVPPGNYTPDELIAALSAQFASTPRINSDPDTVKALGITYTPTHFIQTSINLNTNEVVFTPYKEFLLQNPIINIEPAISQDPAVPVIPGVTYALTIFQKNHGAKVGDVILVQNAISDSGIPSSVINGTHTVTDVIDLDTYKFDLAKFNLLPDRTITHGGVNVFIYVPDIARFRFDRSDTLGTVLGFRNPGDPLSITPYANVISNSNAYEFELSSNSLGQPIRLTNNALQMAGDNYMIMVANPVTVFESISAVKKHLQK
jgi:hypothetical protein